MAPWLRLIWVPFAIVACAGKAASGPSGGTDDGCAAAGNCGDTGVPCKDGDTKPAADPCNTCSCSSGNWVCTMRPCPTPVCKAGDTRSAGDCNTCSCIDGQWGACTVHACPAPTCNDGDTMPAGNDHCNTCSCSNGSWTCTTQACPPVGCGGRLGNPCLADEYCAYEQGALCGAADATATCQKRPFSCAEIYNPVCGCNGTTYSNSCEAAVAGTGLQSNHVCPVSK
jgi:hypothetical protein